MVKFLGALFFAALLFTSCGGEEGSQGDKIKAGFIYIGPAGDYGWTNAHDVARKALDDKYPWLETVAVESVEEGGEAVAIIERLIEEHNVDIVFTTSFGFMEATLEVAQKYPDVIFEHCSGYKTAENVGTYFGDLYQMYYLNGMIAAALSESGKLGYVAAFPIPELFRHINAFTLGAQAVNPEATVDVRWIYAWYGPDKAKEAAEALVANGVDALIFTEDTPAVIEVAERYMNSGQPVYSFGHYSPMAQYGPKSVASGQLIDWTPIYDKILTDLKNDQWSNEPIWWVADKDVAFLGGEKETPINPLYIDTLKATPLGDSNVYDSVMALYARFQEGRDEFDPFYGPIYDNTGAIQIPEGTMATIAELDSMMYYVQGVLGNPPTSN